MSVSNSTRRKKVDHGSDCVACTDPEEAARQRETQRVLIAEALEHSRERRRAGEALQEQWRVINVEDPRWAELKEKMLTEFGEANAIATAALMRRGHLKNIEQAHGITRPEPGR
jgi:hypothetical protein